MSALLYTIMLIITYVSLSSLLFGLFAKSIKLYLSETRREFATNSSQMRVIRRWTDKLLCRWMIIMIMYVNIVD